MRIAVAGAGITGLAAATFLRRAGHEVVVFEAADRPGGAIATRRRDGFVLEDGAVAIRGGRPSIGLLLDAAGLRDRVVRAAPAARRRFLLRDGRLVPWTRAVSLGGWARMGLEILARSGAAEPESVAAFLRRRLGPEAADALGDPIVAGITGGDPEVLDAASLLRAQVAAVRDHGSLTAWALLGPRGTEPTGSFTFPGGLTELIDALVARAGASLHLRRSLEVGGRGEPFDHLVFTTPPEAVAALVPAFRPPRLPRAPIAAVSLGYAPEAIPSGLPGFGWLAHSRERRDALGCQWVSGVFPGHAPAGHHLLRVMVGGTRMPELADRDDGALADHARSILREVQGITADPVLVDVVRVLPGIPQYPLGWRRFLDRDAALPPGVTLAGWHYTGVGVADGIEAARELTNRCRA